MSEETITNLSIALIAVFSTWAVTYYTTSRAARKDAREQREALERDARYLAIRVVCELDPFIYACCDVAMDNGRPGRDGLQEPTVKLPNVTTPTGVDWRALDADLMYRVLSLPNEIAAANQSIAAAMDHVATPPDYPKYFRQRRMSYARLGLAALTLADDLRARFAIPAREDRDEDPAGHLNDGLARAMREQLLDSPMGAIVRAEDAKNLLR